MTTDRNTLVPDTETAIPEAEDRPRTPRSRAQSLQAFRAVGRTRSPDGAREDARAFYGQPDS